MEKVMEFPDREVVEEEALNWLIRLDGDHALTDSEEQQLEAWLARSPAHREALKSLNSFWSNSNILGELVEPQSVKALCRKRIVAYFWPISGFGAAAVASILMVLTVGLMFGGQSITDSNGVYLTAVGQQKTVTLADGSILQLNTNSQIQVDYDDIFRNIRLLQGEVHFEVAKDPGKPFRVYAGSGRVQAVGTAFNVYLKNDDVNVFVTEGRVALASILPVALRVPVQSRELDPVATKPLDDVKDTAEADGYLKVIDRYAKSEINGLGTMAAGEGATLKKNQDGQSVIELVPAVVGDLKKQNSHLAWRQGVLIFSGETLDEVVKEIGRYTPVSIEIVSPELRSLEIGGQIKVGDTDSMFSALEANFGLKIKHLSYNRVQVVAYSQ